MSADLKQFGISSGNESVRLKALAPEEQHKELNKNLEAYANEVLSDNPVSILYHYWPGKNKKLYTNPSLKPIFGAENQFDTQERLGFPKKGFENMTRLILDNPNNIILWYSPKGPASFDGKPDNPYSEINYNYGQLYLQYFDGKKVNALAIKISDESQLSQFSPLFDTLINGSYANERSKIIKMLMTPINTGLDLDAFLDKKYDNQIIYHDNKGGDHDLFTIIQTLRERFAEEKPPFSNSFSVNINKNQLTEAGIKEIYLRAIYQYQQSTGHARINLSGSCGGSTVEISDIEKMLGLRPSLGQNPILEIIGPHSSAWRLIENKGGRYEDYRCPHCNGIVRGEKKDDPQSWNHPCPNCGKMLGQCAR